MNHNSTIYDLAIIGGGPAAVAAGVYASRKRLKTLFVAKEFGGQSSVSNDIQNWIGTPSISGVKLAETLKEHLKTYASDIVDIHEGKYVNSIEKSPTGFKINLEGESFEAKTVLISTGSKRRTLDIPGASKFEHMGVVYCASCDGPLFADMDVVVVGGGNAAFETAAQLLAYAKSVVLLHRSDEFRADQVTVKKVLSHPKMHAVLNAEILEVKGDKFVEAVTYKEKESGKTIELPAQGVFVEIGSVPSTDLVANLVKRDKFNQIVVDPTNQRTSVEGIWSAGDCTDGLYHQNNIAAGDAVKALEDIYMYLHTK